MPGKPTKRHPVTQPSDKSYRLIPLTQGQNALVDAADYEWLSRWNWYAGWSDSVHGFYAMREELNRTIRMHRQILSCTPTEDGDHQNGQTLDNRRQNLRKCTHTQNVRNQRKATRNRSGFKGVCWFPRNGKWLAQIRVNSKTIHLLCWDSKEEAARAYDRAAKKYFGAFARLNFPNEGK